MLSGGLKANIGVNLVLLLGMGMLLINFVIMAAVDRILMQTAKSKGEQLLSIASNEFKTAQRMELNLSAVSGEFLRRMTLQSGFACIMIFDQKMKQIYQDGVLCSHAGQIKKYTCNVIKTGQRTTSYLGKTWGFFSQQNRLLVISAPIFEKSILSGGVSVVMELENIYIVLRHLQKSLLLYILINTMALTFIGMYRLTRITLKPLKRLLKRADDYHETSDEFFMTSKDNNEFNQLSSALNRMLMRISMDSKQRETIVDDLRKTNRKLLKAQQEIIRAEKLASIGRLSSGLAHEIGNPIGIVLGYLELLKRKDINAQEKEEFIVRTEKEINRINLIIKQLLDFSRPGKGIKKTVIVHPVIEDIAAALRVQPLTVGIKITTDLSAPNHIVEADQEQLRQVFLNLLINAADAVHGRVDAKINIKTQNFLDTEKTCFLKIDFCDNGIGISKEHIDNIFDPFFTTKAPGKGTGLGLSVSFRIIEELGGSMQVSSEGHGTSLIIFLPIKETA